MKEEKLIGNSGVAEMRQQSAEAVEEIRQQGLQAVEEIRESAGVMNDVFNLKECPEFLSVLVDNVDGLLEAVTLGGTKVIYLPLELKKGISVYGVKTSKIDNPEYLRVLTDGVDKIIAAVTSEGDCIIAGISIRELAKRVKNLEGGSEDKEYTSFNYIFAAQNDSSPYVQRCREYIQHLYPEGVMGEQAEMTVDNPITPYAPIYDLTRITGTSVRRDHQHILIGHDGTKNVEVNFGLQITKASVAKNKTIRYMAIGDSITENSLLDLYGVRRSAINYEMFVKELFVKDNVDFDEDNINCLMVGTRKNFSNETVDYKDQTLSIRTRMEGRTSWAAATYLRHADLCRVNSGVRLNQQAAWDSLGLGTMGGSRSYVAYTGTLEQNQLIRTTCHGYYTLQDADATEVLWSGLCNVLENVTDAGVVAAKTSYSVSNCKTLMNYLLQHPENPFFYINEVDTSVNREDATAFSFSKYLDRYKTLSDADGTTRLEVGSTAGTEITSSTIDDYDVCTPTHITIALGENDGSLFGAGVTAQDIVNDIDRMVELLEADVPNAHIGILCFRHNGVFSQSYWQDKAVCMQYSLGGTGLIKYNMHKILTQKYPSLSGHTGNDWYIPAFVIQNPLTDQSARYVENFMHDEDNKMVVSALEVVHPGILGHRSVGYQVYSWILYTLSL